MASLRAGRASRRRRSETAPEKRAPRARRGQLTCRKPLEKAVTTRIRYPSDTQNRVANPRSKNPRNEVLGRESRGLPFVSGTLTSSLNIRVSLGGTSTFPILSERTGRGPHVSRKRCAFTSPAAVKYCGHCLRERAPGSVCGGCDVA